MFFARCRCKLITPAFYRAQVCELDLIYGLAQAQYLLDEVGSLRVRACVRACVHVCVRVLGGCNGKPALEIYLLR